MLFSSYGSDKFVLNLINLTSVILVNKKVILFLTIKVGVLSK